MHVKSITVSLGVKKMLVADNGNWLVRKKAFVERIREDIEIGYLDRRVKRLLDIINSRHKSYTTSSCSGRISIIDAPAPWDRRESTVVFKKHDPIKGEELKRLLQTGPKHSYWLVVSGPILHVICKDLEEAKLILEAARRAGFKHSGIASVSEKGLLVEIISSTQLILPLTLGGLLLINLEQVEEIAVLVNRALIEGWRRIDSLAQSLSERTRRE